MKLSTCHYCNRIFTRARSTKQFCDLECKNKYNYARRNNEETPLEVYNRVVGFQTKESVENAKLEEYLDRIRFLENEISKQQEIKTEVTATPVTKPIILNEPTPEKRKQSPKKDIPFLSKKESIIEQLISEDIDTVSKEELEALGYPIGFFDGWSEDGEVLDKYSIDRQENGEYSIKSI